MLSWLLSVAVGLAGGCGRVELELPPLKARSGVLSVDFVGEDGVDLAELLLELG